MRSLKYSKSEIGDILISALILGFSFMILFFEPGFKNYFIALGVVFLCFIPREVVQRCAARKMNIYSTYKLWIPGLLISVISSFLGFVFAVPGTINFSLKYYERFGKNQISLSIKQMGLIVLSGAFFNLILGFIFLLSSFSGVLVLSLIAKVSFYIAFFNLLPFGNLDGVRLLRWAPRTYLILIILSLGMLIAVHFIP